MAWEGLGGTINPGQSITWNYSWGGYHGWDLASARPLNPGSILTVSDHGARLEANNNYTYFVTIRNVGSLAVQYHLTGPS
jgi:hypothetical protein